MSPFRCVPLRAQDEGNSRECIHPSRRFRVHKMTMASPHLEDSLLLSFAQVSEDFKEIMSRLRVAKVEGLRVAEEGPPSLGLSAGVPAEPKRDRK